MQLHVIFYCKTINTSAICECTMCAFGLRVYHTSNKYQRSTIVPSCFYVTGIINERG